MRNPLTFLAGALGPPGWALWMRLMAMHLHDYLKTRGRERSLFGSLPRLIPLGVRFRPCHGLDLLVGGPLEQFAILDWTCPLAKRHSFCKTRRHVIITIASEPMLLCEQLHSGALSIGCCSRNSSWCLLGTSSPYQKWLLRQ